MSTEDNNELQNDELESTDILEADDNNEVEDKGNRRPSGSAPDSEGNHEETASDDEQQLTEQDRVNQAVAKQHAKYREEERKRLALEAELNELRGKQQQTNRPVVPPMPNPYDFDSDEDFNKAVSTRDQKMREVFDWERQNNENSEAQNRTQTEMQQSKYREVQQQVESYAKRATALGVKPEELKAAGQAVGQMGLNESIVNAIIKDDKGPLITRYLARNTMETIELVSMDPVDAILHIERTIRPKLRGSKKVTETPQPREQKKGTIPNERGRFPLTEGRAKFK